MNLNDANLMRFPGQLTRVAGVTMIMLACSPSLRQQPASAPQCGATAGKAIGGGAYLHTEDGVDLWYKATGNAQGPVTFYLHGGPGYNAYAFEKAVGDLLEAHLRMVYLDQRGCGRSWLGEHQEKLGIGPTVEDIERLRKHLNTPKINMIAHSFGGPVALEYLKEHPKQVGHVILVDSLANIGSALTHQLDYLAAIGPKVFPKDATKLTMLAQSKESPFKRIKIAYELLGHLALQRQLHYASTQGQERNERWDEESGLWQCASSAVVEKYAKEGYIDSAHSELMRPLPVPAILFAGRKSHVVGAENIEKAGKALNIPVRWFENSGHFVYVEESKLFVDAVVEFFADASR